MPDRLPSLHLRTLGRAVLERRAVEGPSEAVLRGGKGLALLAYVAAAEGQPVSRDRLADLLWGDESPQRSRGSLRQALHTLRRLLPEDVLLTDRDTVTLRPQALDDDREAFLGAARRGDLRGMLQRCDGDFCALLDVAGAAAFEEWVELERGRLRRVLLDAAERLGPAVLDADPAAALAAARRVHAVAPGTPEGTAFLADALVATGAITEARERLEGARRAAAAAGESIAPGLAERLARLERWGTPVRPAPAIGSIDALGQALVGREEALADLLREGERARGGTPRRLVLTGAPGAGKTRLLDEFEARARLRGARVVRVRVVPAMGAIPFAALVDLVRGLAALPGALGIGERAAVELVALVPELASRFPAARGAPRVAPESERTTARREALADLLAAVAEDRLVLIVGDDLQYADEASVAIIVSARRAPALRLLEVWGMRPGRDPGALGFDRILPVAPFGVRETRELLEGVSPLPTAPWVAPAIERLASRSAGNPQRLLQQVRAAHAAGVLVLAAGAWTVTEPDALLELLLQDPALEAALAALPALEQRLVGALAAWGRPIAEPDLEAIARHAGPPPARPMPDEGSVATALRRLEERGLVASLGSEWRIAHDSIAEAVQRLRDGNGGAPARRALVDLWGARADTPLAVVEHLARTCGTADDLPSAARLTALASRLPATRAAGLRGAALARFVAGAAGRPAWASFLAEQIGLVWRLGPAGLALLASVATLATAALTWLVVQLQPRLVVEVDPVAEDYPLPALSAILAVQPRVVVRDGFGRPRAVDGTVRVRGVDGRVVGDTAIPLRGGRAQFRRLVLRPIPTADSTRPMQVAFTGPWYVRDVASAVRGADPRHLGAPIVRVLSVAVNGTPLDTARTWRATGPDSLRIDLVVEYTTNHATANYIIGATQTWGDRERDLYRLAGLASPVLRGERELTFAIAPPTMPGTYYVLVLGGLEDGVDYLFSSTSWKVGRPSWHDGDDVVDAGVARFEALRRTGVLEVPSRRENGYRFRQGELRLDSGIVAIPGGEVRETTRVTSWRGTAIRVIVPPVPAPGH